MGERRGGRLMGALVGCLLILVFGPAPAGAVLGEQEASVKQDRQFLGGQTRLEDRETYRVHEITDASGAIIREYVSPAGTVFGISWQGPRVPNLQQLLGSYFVHLQEYAQSQTRRRGAPLVIQKSDFVLTNGGHMRWYRGRAYVPSLVPANLSREVVQ